MTPATLSLMLISKGINKIVNLKYHSIWTVILKDRSWLFKNIHIYHNISKWSINKFHALYTTRQNDNLSILNINMLQEV